MSFSAQRWWIYLSFGEHEALQAGPFPQRKNEHGIPTHTIPTHGGIPWVEATGSVDITDRKWANGSKN